MTDFDFLKAAYKVAEKYSTDPSTQNGAILVRNGRILTFGANHFPRGVEEKPERWERPQKYEFVEHAERNVIYKAAREGITCDDTTMYVPWYACADCGRAIIQAGITRVVGHMLPEHENNPRWKESIARALEMLEEAGVKCDYLKGKIGDVQIRMSGEIVEP